MLAFELLQQALEKWLSTNVHHAILHLVPQFGTSTGLQPLPREDHPTLAASKLGDLSAAAAAAVEQA